MNILIFSPIVSHPQNEGNSKRIFTLTKYLQSLGHIIHFVYYEQFAFNKNNFQLMINEWDTMTVIYKTNSIKLSTTGYELDEWYQDDIHTTINEVIETFDIKAVLVNYIIHSKLLDYLPKDVLKIIDTHDIFGDRHTIYENKNCRPYTWYSVSKNDEIKALNRADIIIAIQHEEADYFSKVTDVPVKLINHMESKHFIDRSYTSLKKIGFIGSGNHINEHAIEAFLDEYFKHPLSNEDIQIILAGRICETIKIEHPNIVLMGIVEDLEDFYSEVDVIINPLTFGSGLKIKSIEALSFGVPIISTKIGFEGIKSQHEYHQFDTLSEMVECINTIYETPDKLLELEILSKKIFDKYEASVKYELQNLFTAPVLDNKSTEDDMYQYLEKKETIIFRQHKQIQMLKFDIHIKEQKVLNNLNKIQQLEIDLLKKSKKIERLDTAFSYLISIRFRYNPIKKIKAFKELIKIYYSLKGK